MQAICLEDSPWHKWFIDLLIKSAKMWRPGWGEMVSDSNRSQCSGSLPPERSSVRGQCQSLRWQESITSYLAVLHLNIFREGVGSTATCLSCSVNNTEIWDVFISWKLRLQSLARLLEKAWIQYPYNPVCCSLCQVYQMYKFIIREM